MSKSSQRSKSKLYQLSSAAYQLPLYVAGDHKVVTRSASDIPLLCWPDGRWCLPANVYMLQLYRRGLSRKNRGGTLFTYASNISHIVRFCYWNGIELHELTDNQFTLFIKGLQGERHRRSPEVLARDVNSVLAIGRNCLDFLAAVGRLYLEDLVGPNAQIRSEKKERYVGGDAKRGSSRPVISRYWHHHSFPTPDAKKRRLPIHTDDVTLIREAIYGASGSLFQRKRRYVMLKLLEVTGGRRSEVAAVTVASVREAAGMEHPMLRLLTAKRPGGREEYRFVPISHHDVAFLLEFIRANRPKIVRATCGADNDDGYVLISETSGRKLRPNTITQEIAALAKHAGIKGQSCPHMFRHRYITKLFVALIEQHKINNPDDFRRALLDSESIKQKIQQWTGHSSLKSLDIYINLAFDEVTQFGVTYDMASVQQSIESFSDSLTEIRNEIQMGESPAAATQTLRALIEALERDLKRAHGGGDDEGRGGG